MAQETTVTNQTAVTEAGSGTPGGAAPIAVTSDTPRYQQAFEALQAEAAALKEEELITVNIDIPNALSIVIGALSRLTELRPALAAFGDPAPVASLDKLEAYALALGHAQTLFQATISAPEAITELKETATGLRTQLVSDITALINRGLIDAEQISKLKGPAGYLNLTFDLFLLAAVAREHWKEISGKTVMTMSEITQAETLADQLLNGVGTRERGKLHFANAGETRQRLFTLLVNAYDQVRRGVVFLRWNHDDVDEIAPSLYLARTGRRSKQVSPAREAPKPQAVSVTATTPNVTGGTPAAATPPHPVGLPGGNPFTA